ncbi:MAG: cell division protein ZapA [Chitinophagaceae bacterium]|nr:cell division protein ZapA [Chitinophagaceae bacterium]
MSELIPVNIVVGDRTYRLKIEPADEEMVRKTANLINEKISSFKLQFAGKDMQDYISMVLLWFATEQKQGANPVDAQEALHKIRELTALVEKSL